MEFNGFSRCCVKRLKPFYLLGLDPRTHHSHCRTTYDFTHAVQGKFHIPITEVSMLKSYEAKLDHGQIQWLGEQPAIKSARIIVTILEKTGSKIKRQPPPSIAGKGKTLGNIVSPAYD